MTLALTGIDAAISRGDLITAYDECVLAIAGGGDSLSIRHRQVLTLARMGDLDQAMKLFQTHGLDRSHCPDVRALWARLLKDRALRLMPHLTAPAAAKDLGSALDQAFEAYHTIYVDCGDPYPGINAANLAVLRGNLPAAQALAGAVLSQPLVARPQTYYMAATAAEAMLILGQVEQSAEALHRAASLCPHDHGARSTTCRQLALVADHLRHGRDVIEDLLRPVQPARVAHFSGHVFAPDTDNEAKITKAIEDHLVDLDIGFAYGALAAGADILFAEAMLASERELHIVLPFAIEDFITQSVLPAGRAWLDRFNRCLNAASSCTMASEMGYVGDSAQFAYGSQVAMGRAALRARHLGNEPLQIVIWDGQPGPGPAGTGADVAAWRGTGRQTHIIDAVGLDRSHARPNAVASPGCERALAAILFTDFPGFSKLAEALLPKFWDGVMRRIADVLSRHDEEVWCRNSWGDALYAVVSSAGAAAHIALELHDRLTEFDYGSIGITGTSGMRIGAHFGPAYRATDPITGRVNFYGTEVSRAARIEPVTPAGTIFVTEPFAAMLMLEAPDQFDCRYVGRIELAKGYGTYPMYRLTRNQ